jgi:hypothetical protein
MIPSDKAPIAKRTHLDGIIFRDRDDLGLPASCKRAALSSLVGEWGGEAPSAQSSWLDAGWKVEGVCPRREVVTFIRTAPSPTASSMPPIASTGTQSLPAAPVEEVYPKRDLDLGESVDLRFGFDWCPIGKVSLDAHGKLRFPAAPSAPGLYRFSIHSASRDSAYVGETDNVQRRFQGYRTPGVTQSTNIRIRQRLVDDLF